MSVTTKPSLLEQIESISCDALDPMHPRESLVLKMRQIYQLAVLANAKDSGDDE